MILLASIPLMSMAQSNWEIPEANKPQEEQVKVKKAKKAKAPKAEKAKKAPRPIKAEDRKHITGAVPEVDGKVVFTLDKDVPGLSATEIYNRIYASLDSMAKGKEQTGGLSKIALVNKTEHIIAARYREWLVFTDAALSLDRTVFNYTILAQATDGHLHATLERITYQYEMDRGGTQGLNISAEEWIDDKNGLTKDQSRLARKSGKFRRKTIDRKDQIFGNLCHAVGIMY